MMRAGKKIMVGLYLKGDALDPETLTQLVGVVPTTAHRRGEPRRSPTGHEYFTQMGIWGYVLDQDRAELEDVVGRFVTALDLPSVLFTKLPGVQEAYVDVFIAADSDEDGACTCEMTLTAKQVMALSSYGLPVRFTVAIGRP